MAWYGVILYCIRGQRVTTLFFRGKMITPETCLITVVFLLLRHVIHKFYIVERTLIYENFVDICSYLDHSEFILQIYPLSYSWLFSGESVSS